MNIKLRIATVGSVMIALLAPSAALAALTVGSTSVVSDAVLSLSGAVGSNVVLGSATTTGSIQVGNSSHQGGISIGLTTGNYTTSIMSSGLVGSGTLQTTNIGNGTTASGAINRIKIGNNDAGDGTTNITIGDGFKFGGTTTVNIASVGTLGTGDTVSIGNASAASSLTLKAGTGNMLLQGAVTTTYTMGTSTGTGTITIGLSTASNTISIGSATTGAGNTQTINIGSAATGTGKATIVIGNTTATNASTVAIRSGLTGNSGGILLEGPLNYGAAADGDDDYDITILPAPSAYSTGMMIMFTAATANTTGATINVNSLGSKALVKGNNAALATNDIIAGRTYIAVYDGTQFDLINPATE